MMSPTGRWRYAAANLAVWAAMTSGSLSEFVASPAGRLKSIAPRSHDTMSSRARESPGNHDHCRIEVDRATTIAWR